MNNIFNGISTVLSYGYEPVKEKEPKALTTLVDLEFTDKADYIPEDNTIQFDFSQGGVATSEVTLKAKTQYKITFNIRVINNLVKPFFKVIEGGVELCSHELDGFSLPDFNITTTSGLNTFVEFSSAPSTSNFVIHDLKVIEIK